MAYYNVGPINCFINEDKRLTSAKGIFSQSGNPKVVFISQYSLLALDFRLLASPSSILSLCDTFMEDMRVYYGPVTRKLESY